MYDGDLVVRGNVIAYNIKEGPIYTGAFVGTSTIGIPGDGVTEASQAFNAVLAQGRSIVLEPGTYAVGSQLVLPNNTSIVGHRDASLLCSVSHASALKLAGLNASIESLDVRCSTDAAVDQSVVWASGPSTSVRDVRFFDAPSGILVTSNSCSVSDVSMSNVRTLGGVLFNSQDPDARLDLAKVVVQCAANSNADGVVWYGAGTGNQQVALDTCTILNARRGFVTL